MGDKGGEAITFNHIGRAYSDLGEKRQALDYYEKALPMLRQVGDRWSESVTRSNMAVVAEALDDLARAEAEMANVVAIDAAVGHPDIDSHRRYLNRIQEKVRSNSQ